MNTTDTIQQGQQPAAAVRQVSAMERHLIDDGWLMRADDEALGHDCQTWWRLDSNPSGKWMIGAPYTRGLFVPIRRNGPRPPNEIERLLFSPNISSQPTPTPATQPAKNV